MAINVWTGATNTAYSTTTNWSLGAVPVNTNDVVFTNSTIAVASGLAQSGVTLNSFTADMSYTGLIGTATSYLNTGATNFYLGTPVIGGGVGSRRLNIQAANSGAIVTVFNTATSANDTTFTPVRLLLTAGVLNVDGGIVGVALYYGETSSVATLNMTSGTNVPQVFLGQGNTLTTATIAAGQLVNYSTNTTTTVTLNGNSSLVHYGTGAFTTINCGSGSTVSYIGTGTITTLNLRGTLDMSGGTGAVTITNCTLQSGASIIDPLHRLTFTNPVLLSQCRPTDVALNVGYSRSVSFS